MELFAGLVALLVVLTFLPPWRHEAWWVRDLDFPRLQLSFLSLLLIVVGALLLDSSRPSTWMILGGAAGCLLFHGWWILPYTPFHRQEVMTATPGSAAPRLRVLAVNVLTPNRSSEPLLEMIRRREPDVVVAVETDAWWQERLDTLVPEYLYTVKCPLDNLYGMRLYSRFPLEDARIQFLVEDDIPSMHAVLVLASGHRVRLHALHPAPPSPTENASSSERDAELMVVGKSVRESGLPVVVTGDLNDVAWSATTRLFRKISGLLDPRIGRGMFNTFHARYPFIRWPLDHLFHSGHFRVARMERLPAFGSDHFPILVELQLSGPVPENASAVEADEEDRRWAEEKLRDEGVGESAVHSPGE